MISVFVMVYNEEHIMQWFIDHYRTRFPGCPIFVYDNFSVDSTAEIARRNDCQVWLYDSGGEVNDQILRNHKNNCWRNSPTNWVLVCDADELLEIDEAQLRAEEANGTTIVKATGYTMVNMVDDPDPSAIDHGYRETYYDKSMLFDRRHIQHIDYDFGAHFCYPKGNVRFNSQSYRMLHYNTMGLEFALKKKNETMRRMSALNRQLGLGLQYFVSDDEVRAKYAEARRIATKIL